MASSSSSHQQNEEPPRRRRNVCLRLYDFINCRGREHNDQEHHAFSGIEPRKVDESRRLYDVFINHRGPDVKDTLASSSSSHQQNEEPHNDQEHHAFSGIEPPGIRRKVDESRRLYDVFINHRGPDVKDTLATQLYNSLRELGISAFLDSKEKELGDSLPSTIETAIRSAAVHIAIFSKKYAESPWCLAELVLMLQSKAKIVPVFYDVQPGVLRHIEKGVYADAFTNYEKKSRYLQKLKEWKEALQSVSFLTGEEFNGDCKNIVSAVQKEYERIKPKLPVAKYPVGLHKLVQDFEKECLDELVHDFESQCRMSEEGKDKPKIVGIFGMGGIGKTTLSKELFNRKRSQYSRGCFLFDVREAYVKREVPSLQMQLVKDIFDENPSNFKSIEEGASYIEDCIARSNDLSFLVILDDIDHADQLDAFSSIHKSRNSLVIVTTRDVGVLVNTGITTGYNLKGMDRAAAKELFCWHAFQQPHPTNGYEDLVNAFLDGCGGLPLSLQVLGRHVRGRDKNYWRLELKKVSTMLPQDIKQRLKISFDSLDNEEKQIFMDIACFFINGMKKMALRIWEGSRWNGEHALQKLKDKCLVEEIEIRAMRGNELLKGLVLRPLWGNELVLRMHDCLRDLGREMSDELRTRMWRLQDIESMGLEGFQSILSSNRRCFGSLEERSMKATIRYFIGNSNGWSHTSTSLLWLEIHFNSYVFKNRTQMRSIPSWIPLQNLQYLAISNGDLIRLWESDVKQPSSLKELWIEKTILEEFPHLTRMSNHLEKVVLNGKEIPIEWFFFVESLKTANLSGDDKYATFESSSSHVVLNGIEFRGLVALNNKGQSPTVESPMSSLRKVEFERQHSVTKVLISGYHYPNLESLHLAEMRNLTVVDLSDLSHLSCFKRLSIEHCNELNCLELDDCANLKEVYIADLPKLVKISIHHCSKLETVIIKRCEKLQNIAGIEEWPTLKHMEIPLCNGVAIRNCIHSLQRVPCEHMMVIESAAEGAESTLGAHLFSQWIAAEEVIQLGAHVFPQWIQLGLHEDNLVETMADVGSLGAIIYCAVVAIHCPFSTRRVIVVGSRSLSSLVSAILF
ncbi:hypothetical protein KI387_032717 [Taxus chinensis]|uniref:TIR domain-containing protein n=1 Tax=Taxus chinensis TaxID=29808 RepID=A0AA38BPW6_TAXCH|nr:hypothetical protein KI387_032717 [Taxus chinensis]